MLSSAEVRLPAARHQNAAVALLQQVLITQSAGRHTSASLLKIILSGVFKPEDDILSRRVNSIQTTLTITINQDSKQLHGLANQVFPLPPLDEYTDTE